MVQEDDVKSFRRFVENALKKAAPGDVSYYALTQISAFMTARGIEVLDGAAVREWVVGMLLEGMKPSTCKRYVGRVHALYDEWRGTIDDGGEAVATPQGAPAEEGTVLVDDPFEGIGAMLTSAVETRAEDARHNLALVPRLLSKTETSADYQTVCILLYLLYQPAATLGDVIALKFDTADRTCPQVDDIISSRQTGKGRKYVFALGQGKTTLARIARELDGSLAELMRVVGMRVGESGARDTLTAIWIAAALRARIAPADIRAVVGTVPAVFSALTLLPKRELSRAEYDRVIAAVADTLNDNATHWYAMRLRQGVQDANVKARIDETLPGRLASMDFYAPTRESVRKEKHRIIKEKVPYIPGLIFFKTRADRVRGLFAKIGDLAWCYRTGDRPDSPYSIIPRSEMARFQHCVGQFTDDMRVELHDVADLLPGRRVRVTGGIMAGYEGEITDIEGEPGSHRFSLRISDTVRASWIAKVEDYYIEAI